MRALFSFVLQGTTLGVFYPGLPPKIFARLPWSQDQRSGFSAEDMVDASKNRNRPLSFIPAVMSNRMRIPHSHPVGA